MQTQFLINQSTNANTRYFTWARTACELRLRPDAGEQLPANLILRNIQSSTGGKLVFLLSPGATENGQLQVPVSPDGRALFYIAGKFGSPSSADKDAGIEVLNAANGRLIYTERVMVRVRKNANKLTPLERDLFIEAFSILNNSGTGRFAEFRNVHRTGEQREYYNQAHGAPGFLPWHRAYLLDLERELQKIIPSVTIPYWKFDEPAPNVFSRDFMGRDRDNGLATFNSAHLFNNWRSDNRRITRDPRFDTLNSFPANVMRESDVVRLSSNFNDFRNMESNPHDRAHIAFLFDLSDVETAANDPLFFLLHNNTDRIWALWQVEHGRFDTTNASTYPQGSQLALGHNLNDTMWPWNQQVGAPRPGVAPGGTMATSPIVPAPGLSPRIGDMFDYQGLINPANNLGFSYDDVPYRRTTPLFAGSAPVSVSALPSGMNTASLKNVSLLKRSLRDEVLTTIANTEFDPELRSLAINKSGAAIRDEDAYITSLLQILGNSKENVSLRLDALLTLKEMNISSRTFKARTADFLNTLRGIIRDSSQKIRVEALTALALQKDFVAREALKDGLENPDKALVKPEKAIQLLGFDIHTDIFPLLKNIVNNPPNEESKLEAIQILGADANSSDLLSELLSDSTQSSDVRVAAALSLQSARFSAFNSQAKKIIADKAEDTRLQAIILNGLTLNAGLKEIREDKELADLASGLVKEGSRSSLQISAQRFLRSFQ